MTAELSFPVPTTEDRRWLNLQLGGGAVRDLGIYPMSLAYRLLGPPNGFEASGTIAKTGVETVATIESEHAGDSQAVMKCAFGGSLSNEAVVRGEEGSITLRAPFHHSPEIEVHRTGHEPMRINTSPRGHGFLAEVVEAERCVLEGEIESPQRSHAETVAVMEWIDAVLHRLGVSEV
ncbi:MAG: Gfo/Idh/MocA family protein, partial [Longimicrobiales bacterium]